jgi:hypothetical protein
VILVIAEAGDEGASAFAAELAPVLASVITCSDLAAQASHLSHPEFEDSALSVGGRSLPVSEISGVVNTLPTVAPGSLLVYEPGEREYQASELHAWLTYALSALSCPVVNRPTALSLNGPVLNPLGWFHLAHAAGIPVAAVEVTPDRANAGKNSWPDVVEAVCVGGEIAVGSHAVAEAHTLELARHAQVAYLRARYEDEGTGEIRFAGASSVPDLRCDSTRRVLTSFLGR